MPQAKQPPGVMADKLSAVVDAIGELMGCYPEGSDIQEEFRAMRREATGIVTGDLTDTLEQGQNELREGYRKVKTDITQTRLDRVLKRLDDEDSVGLTVRESQMFRELAASRG